MQSQKVLSTNLSTTIELLDEFTREAKKKNKYRNILGELENLLNTFDLERHQDNPDIQKKFKLNFEKNPLFLQELLDTTKMLLSQRWSIKGRTSTEITQNMILEHAEQAHIHTILFTQSMLEMILKKITARIELIDQLLAARPLSILLTDPNIRQFCEEYRSNLVSIKKYYAKTAFKLKPRITPDQKAIITPPTPRVDPPIESTLLPLREAATLPSTHSTDIKISSPQPSMQKYQLANEQERGYFSSRAPMTLLINQLGGRYFPFHQGLDPLSGSVLTEEKISEFSGACYGYVKEWATNLKQSGSSPSTPILSHSTFAHQNKQNIKSIAIKQCALNVNFREVIDTFFKKMNRQNIYGISILQHYHDGHQMGLRYTAPLPPSNKNEIEFFDPNLGIVIFNDESAAKIWLAAYLCDTYGAGRYTLDDFGTQKPNALPTIAPLINTPPFSAEYFFELEKNPAPLLIFTAYDKEHASREQLQLLQYLSALELLPLLNRDQKPEPLQKISSELQRRLASNERFNAFRQEFKLPIDPTKSKCKTDKAYDTASCLHHYELNLLHELALRKLTQIKNNPDIIDAIKTAVNTHESFQAILQSILKNPKCNGAISKKFINIDLDNPQKIKEFNTYLTNIHSEYHETVALIKQFYKR
jgi:hypothetical protein